MIYVSRSWNRYYHVNETAYKVCLHIPFYKHIVLFMQSLNKISKIGSLYILEFIIHTIYV